MKIEYFSELDCRFLTNPNKGRRWMLLSPFIFTVDGEEFTAPAEFYTDFASIPRFIWPIIAPYEIGKGPIPHDLGYYTGMKTKEFWDKVLRACMEMEKIDQWKHAPVYQAVNWFGGFTWRNYRKQGSTAKQLQRVLVRTVMKEAKGRGAWCGKQHWPKP